MTDLEFIGLALKRAIEKAMARKPTRDSDFAAVAALNAVLIELDEMHAERGWQFEPTGLKASEHGAKSET